MDLLRFILKIFDCVSLISFYLCVVIIIIPINFVYVCVMTTYYMFEYNTISMTKINEHLSDMEEGNR